MGSVPAANTYYNSAMKKMESGENSVATQFFEKAAREYMEAMQDLNNKLEKDFAQERVNDCIYNIRRMNAPKTGHMTEGEENKPSYTFKVEHSDLDFEKVAGMIALKEKIYDDIVLPLVHPEIKKFVDDTSRGIIMYGPPGCGKTYIARAAAGEASKKSGRNVGFIYVRSSDLIRSLVGETEQNIRKLFETAAENAPVILFFDEIQSIGMSRTDDNSSHGQRFLTEMLQDFDLIENKEVLVLGATNYPHLLDPALFREGRFDETIVVNPPDLEARLELFHIYLSRKPADKNMDLKQLAVLTQDYSSADIRKICNDAGIRAGKEHITGNTDRVITQQDLVSAINNYDPSIYVWIDKTKRLIENGQIDQRFVDEMSDMLDQINARRFRLKGGEVTGGGPVAA